MAKKHKDPGAAGEASPAAAIRSLFSSDNPFRRKSSAEEPPATPLRKHPKPEAEASSEPSSKKKNKREGQGPQRKRKRDEVEAGRRRRSGAAKEKRPGVGEKRKAPDNAAAGAGEDDEEAFDDETKLLRTVFVGNLPLRTKRKVLTKEFAAFGEIESIRIRSVPLVDVSTMPLSPPSSLFQLTYVERFQRVIIVLHADQAYKERGRITGEGQ